VFGVAGKKAKLIQPTRANRRGFFVLRPSDQARESLFFDI
jgi:hypothetical protein